MWNLVGMGRTLQGLVEATKEIEEVRKEFYSDLRIVGEAEDLNTELEKALRLEDFLVIAKMMAGSAEAVGAVVAEVALADGEETLDGGLQFVVHPDTAHGVVAGTRAN